MALCRKGYWVSGDGQAMERWRAGAGMVEGDLLASRRHREEDGVDDRGSGVLQGPVATGHPTGRATARRRIGIERSEGRGPTACGSSDKEPSASDGAFQRRPPRLAEASERGCMDGRGRGVLQRTTCNAPGKRWRPRRPTPR